MLGVGEVLGLGEVLALGVADGSGSPGAARAPCDTPVVRASTVSTITGVRIPLSYQSSRGWQVSPATNAPSSDDSGAKGVPVQPKEAEQIVELLRARRIMAHVHPTGLQKRAIRVVLPGGREAIWDADSAAGLEAQILADGMLVGFVPLIAGSEDFDATQAAQAIATADYGLG